MSGAHPEAGGVPAPAARFALLAVDGVAYAVESAWVRRSLPAPEPPPPTVLHGGAAFPVIDLRRLFGLPPSPGAGGEGGAPGAGRLILLLERPARSIAHPPAPTGDNRSHDRPAGEGAASGADTGTGDRWALVVDGLLGLEPLAPGAAVPLPAVYRGPERGWFRGVVPRADGQVTVLLRLAGLGPAGAPCTGGAGC